MNRIIAPLLLVSLTPCIALAYPSYMDETNLVMAKHGFVVSTNQNVGIGTDRPNYKLHVSGNVMVYGNLTSSPLVTSTAVDWSLGNIQTINLTDAGSYAVVFETPPLGDANLTLVVNCTVASTNFSVSARSPSILTWQYGLAPSIFLAGKKTVIRLDYSQSLNRYYGTWGGNY